MSEGKKPREKDVSSVRIAAEGRVRGVDPRAHAAWRTWLKALADDPEAATAAALAYDSLPDEARDAWIDALDADRDEVDVPAIALYAPLLGIEVDDARRARLAERVSAALEAQGDAPRAEGPRTAGPRALVGTKEGATVCVLVSPLYLDFVEILLCSYVPDGGIREARHEGFAHRREVEPFCRSVGATLAPAPLGQVVEDIAHAVVADRRAGREAPEVLLRYVDLFAPDLDALERPPSSEEA